jgi:hypothetical protein
MPLTKVRGFLYWLARFLGDVNAVQRGKIPQRLVRRIAGKFTGRLLGRLFRGVVLVALVARPGWAGEAERSPGGLTTLTPDGGRIRVEGNRLDIFRRDGSREGYGIQRSDGSWDVFNTDGTRRATIERGPSGETRATVPRPRK